MGQVKTLRVSKWCLLSGVGDEIIRQIKREDI